MTLGFWKRERPIRAASYLRKDFIKGNSAWRNSDWHKQWGYGSPPEEGAGIYKHVGIQKARGFLRVSEWLQLGLLLLRPTLECLRKGAWSKSSYNVDSPHLGNASSYEFKAAFVCFLVALVQFFGWDVAEERSFQPSRFSTIQELCSFVLWAQMWIAVQFWAESSPTLALSQAAVLTAVFTRWPFISLPLLEG